MKKIFSILLLIVGFSFFAVNSSAEEKMVFDSTDNYLGGCQLTNKSEWELKEDLDIAKFQLWYRWDDGETTLPVTVKKDGEKFAEFAAERAACDPYQKMWCNADYQINKLFSKGSYAVEIKDSRMCLKPGGTGTVRLYSGETVKKDEPTPTKEVQPTAFVPAKSTTTCSCNQNQTTINSADGVTVGKLVDQDIIGS